MRIAIITDSYGLPRFHKGRCEVKRHDTYPYIVKERLGRAGMEVECNCESYRRIVDIPSVIPSLGDFDAYVIQVGIVDLFPRPLSMAHTKSRELHWRLLRKIIRINRRFITRFFRTVTWSSEDEVSGAIRTVNESLHDKKVLWVNVSPVNSYMESIAPGANESLLRVNELLKRGVSAHSNAELLDVFSEVVESQDPEVYFHPTDSHLNIRGNQLYAELLCGKLLA